MNFSSAAVSSVFATYEEWATKDDARIAELGEAAYQHLDELLLPVGPEVGWFLHSLIIAARPARILELGTSYGYSTLFLADAAKQVGAKLITMDVAEYKQAAAHRNVEKAGLADAVEFRLGDAVELIKADAGTFDFVLLDIWKSLYLPCLQALYPKLSDEGIIAADNMIEPEQARESVREYRAALRALPDLQTTLLPIGYGVELSTRWKPGNVKL